MSPTILSLLVAAATLPGAAPGEITLRINLPERRLDVVEGTETIRSYPAAIGAPGYPTPTGRYRVSSITWNPWWTPPASEWARGKKKTPPGARNPMGRAKLRFDRLLYVHGTNDEASLGTAASHGCIRLSNEHVLELARLIAERTGALSIEEISALESAPRRTREVSLPGEGIPLLIEYRLVRETEAGVRRFDDVYGKGLLPHEQWLLEQAGGAAGEPGNPPGPGAESASASGLGLAVVRGARRLPNIHVEDPMDPRSYGPQIFPSAPLVRKRWEARLDQLPPLRDPEPRPARPERGEREEPRA